MPPEEKKQFSPEFLAQQWKPGQSGNPEGGRKRKSFEAIVAQVLDEQVPGSDQSKREVLARVFVDEMLKRNGAMIREYLTRAWPAVQKHEVELPEATDASTLLDRLARIPVPKRTNGSGREPEPERSNGGNGVAS